MLMKASELKNTGKIIELLDGNHKITIDFNAYGGLEEIYGDMQTAFSKFTGKVNSKDVKNFISVGINACIEDENEHFTPFQVGKLLDIRKTQIYVDLLLKLLNESMPAPKKDEDEDVESVTSVEDGKN